EYFGGWVAAGAVLRSGGNAPDVAAERCVDGVNRAWLLPDETATADQRASLIVMNPYPTPAEFDVVIRTGEPRTVRPGELTPAVLAPHTAVSIDVNRWALQRPNEETVGVQVSSVVGRVIAGSVVVSAKGVRAEAGIAAAAERSVIPAAGYARGA